MGYTNSRKNYIVMGGRGKTVGNFYTVPKRYIRWKYTVQFTEEGEPFRVWDDKIYEMLPNDRKRFGALKGLNCLKQEIDLDGLRKKDREIVLKRREQEDRKPIPDAWRSRILAVLPAYIVKREWEAPLVRADTHKPFKEGQRYLGNIKAEYTQLVKVFGKPSIQEDDSLPNKYYWRIIEKGYSLTVYDWEMVGKDPKKGVTDWYVSGYYPRGLQLLKNKIKKSL